MLQNIEICIMSLDQRYMLNKFKKLNNKLLSFFLCLIGCYTSIFLPIVDNVSKYFHMGNYEEIFYTLYKGFCLTLISYLFSSLILYFLKLNNFFCNKKFTLFFQVLFSTLFPLPIMYFFYLVDF